VVTTFFTYIQIQLNQTGLGFKSSQLAYRTLYLSTRAQKTRV